MKKPRSLGQKSKTCNFYRMKKDSITKRYTSRGGLMIGALVGGALGDFGKNYLGLNPWIENAIVTGVGVIGVGIEKNPGMIAGIGAGLIGNGGAGFLEALMDAGGKTAIKGPEETETESNYQVSVSGPQDINALSGPQDINALSGPQNLNAISSPDGEEMGEYNEEMGAPADQNAGGDVPLFF
jgi:hypothetical protein